jgi:hypothetical protein
MIVALSGCGGSKQARSGGAPSSAPKATHQTSPAPGPPSLKGNTVTVSAGSLIASMRASGHKPKVDAPWPVRFTVTRAGRPARASVTYEFLFAGQVVAHRSHYTFTGRFSDVLTWPSSAVGYPLTFRAAMSSDGTLINLDYQVQVTR